MLYTDILRERCIQCRYFYNQIQPNGREAQFRYQASPTHSTGPHARQTASPIHPRGIPSLPIRFSFNIGSLPLLLSTVNNKLLRDSKNPSSRQGVDRKMQLCALLIFSIHLESALGAIIWPRLVNGGPSVKWHRLQLSNYGRVRHVSYTQIFQG